VRPLQQLVRTRLGIHTISDQYSAGTEPNPNRIESNPNRTEPNPSRVGGTLAALSVGRYCPSDSATQSDPSDATDLRTLRYSRSLRHTDLQSCQQARSLSYSEPYVTNTLRNTSLLLRWITPNSHALIVISCATSMDIARHVTNYAMRATTPVISPDAVAYRDPLNNITARRLNTTTRRKRHSGSPVLYSSPLSDTATIGRSSGMYAFRSVIAHRTSSWTTALTSRY
jgi:hypothetical protein